MKSFKQYIRESIDAIAGVGFGEGDQAKSYRFKVSDLIDHAQQKNENGEDQYPVQHIDPRSMADNIESRKGSESKKEEIRRTKNADVSYPIIATHRPDGSGLHILDGTHRLGRAIENNHETIPVRVIPLDHLEKFKI